MPDTVPETTENIHVSPTSLPLRPFTDIPEGIPRNIENYVQLFYARSAGSLMHELTKTQRSDTLQQIVEEQPQLSQARTILLENGWLGCNISQNESLITDTQSKEGEKLTQSLQTAFDLVHKAPLTEVKKLLTDQGITVTERVQYKPGEEPLWRRAKNAKAEEIKQMYTSALLNAMILVLPNTKGETTIKKIMGGETLSEQTIDTNPLTGITDKEEGHLTFLSTRLKEIYTKLPVEFSQQNLTLRIIQGSLPIQEFNPQSEIAQKVAQMMETPDLTNIVRTATPYTWRAKIKELEKQNDPQIIESGIIDILKASRYLNILSNFISNSLCVPSQTLKEELLKIISYEGNIGDGNDLDVNKLNQINQEILTNPIYTPLLTRIDQVRILSNAKNQKTTLMGEIEKHSISPNDTLIKEISAMVSGFDTWMKDNHPQYHKKVRTSWQQIFPAIQANNDDIFWRNNPEAFSALHSIYRAPDGSSGNHLERLWGEYCQQQGYQSPLFANIISLEEKNRDQNPQSTTIKEQQRFYLILMMLYSNSKEQNQNFEQWLENGMYPYMVLLNNHFRMKSVIFRGATPTISKKLLPPTVESVGRNSNFWPTMGNAIKMAKEQTARNIIFLLAKNIGGKDNPPVIPL